MVTMTTMFPNISLVVILILTTDCPSASPHFWRAVKMIIILLIGLQVHQTLINSLTKKLQIICFFMWYMLWCVLQKKVWFRKRDLRLNIHFLYQCHMRFTTVLIPLGDRKQSWVYSILWKKWIWSQIMTNSFTPSSQRLILDPFFTRRVSSEHSDTKMAFFRNTNQGEINFVCNPSLSQQHTLTRSGNWCYLPCIATDIKGPLNGLLGGTMN